MKRILVVLLLPLLVGSDSNSGDPIRGFPSAQWRAQRELEQRMAAVPDPQRLREYMRRMTAEPHHAGSPGSRKVAEYALGLFREWGYEARLESFEALLPYPKSRSLELIGKYKAKLDEPAIAEDPDSSDDNQLPTYNAYGADGDVTAPLVYVNYGIPEDYKTLDRLGIDVKGKIVIARYGRSWRGTKAKVAQERGALGCLIYSDPREDGFFQGDVYPKGAHRPPLGVQRGSVMDMPLYTGDPLSPGWASEPGSKRLPRDQATTVMKIPVLPISYEDAKPLLESLGGPVAPEGWRGALPLTYHIGPGAPSVRLRISMDWSTRPFHNVIAVMPGTQFPDEWITYGNHHDAWVNGALDPISGAISVLEAARSLSELRRGGWRPKRTVIFALWDAEEFGLIGSTEWVEKHRDELRNKLIAYINSDTNGTGALSAGGSHSLEQFVREVARDYRDPISGDSLVEARSEQKESKNGDAKKGLRLGPLGAGSDYVAFLHHAGISSLNLGFAGEGAGVYHSIYDSFHWYTHFSDKNFDYGRTLARVTAAMMLRLSETPVLPHEFGTVSRTVDIYLDEIRKLAGKSADKLELRELTAASAALGAKSKEYEAALGKMLGRPLPAKQKLAALNAVLLRAEQALAPETGLPRRTWYKHQLYAPGTYTGYSAKTLPVVREAVEAGRYKEANAGAVAVASALRAYTAEVDKAMRLMGK